MILVVDLGNTRLKWAMVSDEGELLPGAPLVHRGRNPSAWVPNWLEGIQDPARVLICSVGPQAIVSAIEVQAEARWGVRPEKFGTAEHTCGVTNGYLDYRQLGADRWAALLGARELCQGAACIVDAGSAVTIDLMAGDGRHMGGLIVPGLALMRSAVGRGTEGVPVADSTEPPRLEPGRSTRTGLENGILYSLISFVERACGDMEATLGQPLERLITGGDAARLVDHLEGRFQFDRDLVLRGLVRFVRSTGR